MKKNILIIGYPKSGNTWVNRLTAELLDCPAGGYWMSPEGKTAENNSEYACYKSHHEYGEIQAFHQKPDKIVYVVRDPRDVALSGVKYFNRLALLRYIGVKNKFLAWPIKVFDSIVFEIFNRSKMKRKMIDAVLHGNEAVHPWCKLSWREHSRPFIDDSNVLVVSYEETLSNPVKCAQQILDFIGIHKSEGEIENAISKQGVKKTKKKNKANAGKGNGLLAREGGKSYWMTEMNDDELKLFSDQMGDTMLHLGYVLS